MKKLSADRKLVVFSDSRMCIDGINMWMCYWKDSAWTRDGRPLKNSDLWKVLDSAISDLKNAVFNVVFKHIPAHVGIYDNEKTDRLVKAAMARSHKAVPRTAVESQDRILERFTNYIVFCLSAAYVDKYTVYLLYIACCIVTNTSKTYPSNINPGGGLIVLLSVQL